MDWQKRRVFLLHFCCSFWLAFFASLIIGRVKTISYFRNKEHVTLILIKLSVKKKLELELDFWIKKITFEAGKKSKL